MMLPPPLTKLSELLQSGGTVVYEITKSIGGVRDEQMCVLADIWNMQGLTTSVDKINTNEYENVSCAILTEKKIAITPGDEEFLGEELYGISEEIYINDKLALNKLFFVSYILLGLVLSSILTDVFLSMGLFSNKTSLAMGGGITVSLSLVLLLFRTETMWSLLLNLINVIPGNGLLANGIFFILALSVGAFVVGQISLGYHAAKNSQRTFAAMRLAVKADKDRGELMLKEAEKKSK